MPIGVAPLPTAESALEPEEEGGPTTGPIVSPGTQTAVAIPMPVIDPTASAYDGGIISTQPLPNIPKVKYHNVCIEKLERNRRGSSTGVY